MLVMFLYDVISACRDVTDVAVDTSTSTRHIHQLILVRFCVGKKLIVQSLEVFCEVVRFARGDRDFLK